MNDKRLDKIGPGTCDPAPAPEYKPGYEPGVILEPASCTDLTMGIPAAYAAKTEDVTGPPVAHADRYIALYAMEATPPVPGDMDGPLEYNWYTMPDAQMTWQAAFGSLLGTAGIKCVKIVKISVPCYILPKSQVS